MSVQSPTACAREDAGATEAPSVEAPSPCTIPNHTHAPFEAVDAKALAAADALVPSPLALAAALARADAEEPPAVASDCAAANAEPANARAWGMLQVWQEGCCWADPTSNLATRTLAVRLAVRLGAAHQPATAATYPDRWRRWPQRWTRRGSPAGGPWRLQGVWEQGRRSTRFGVLAAPTGCWPPAPSSCTPKHLRQACRTG